MPRGPDRQEGVLVLVQDMAEPVVDSPGGAEYRCPAVSIENRIRFDPAAALPSDCLEEIEVGLRVHLEQQTRVSGRSRDNAGRRLLSKPVENSW